MTRLTLFFSLLALLGIGLFAWLTRVYQLGFPAGYVFDETYHVPAIRLIAANDPRTFEWWHGPIDSLDNHDWLHPPLAKYIQAGFYNYFGQDAFSWRLASAVFGVAGIGLVFIVTQLAFRRPVVSLLAALLLSLDGLWLVQSRVAMNDVFVTVWLLAAVAVYIWAKRQIRPEWLLLVGLFGGLGLATKWSAVFWLSGFLIWEVLAIFKQKTYKKLPWLVFSLVIVPIAIYVLSFAPMFSQGKDLTYFVELHKNIFRYEVYRGGSHPYQSVPWQWFLNLKPVWYWHGGENQNISAFNNPLLAWLEVGAVFFAGGTLLRRQRKKDSGSLELLVMIFAVTFLPWLASPRILFYYHYLPATPIAAILLAYWLDQMYLRRTNFSYKTALFLILVSLVWVFWFYYPHWIGLPVSDEFARAIYFTLPGG